MWGKDVFFLCWFNAFETDRQADGRLGETYRKEEEEKEEKEKKEITLLASTGVDCSLPSTSNFFYLYIYNENKFWC